MSDNRDTLIIGINLGDFGSTGNIMVNSLEYAYRNGPFDVVACVPFITKNINSIRTVSFSTHLSRCKKYFYTLLRKIGLPLVNDGNYYVEYTNNLIRIIKSESERYKHTIIHLHNIHGCGIHVTKFYKWLSKHDEFVVLYTLHDCWTFTGGCFCYDFIKCDKWQKNCFSCPQHIKYASTQLNKRTRLLNRIRRLTLIPCSRWLDMELSKSKLKDIPRIVNNGETSLFPNRVKSNLKESLKIGNKKVLISVSAYWNEWKGIKYLFTLADMLPDDYVLILVGGIIDYKHHRIIHVPTIDDQSVLADYYSIADVFVSTTQSDNLPLVLMEAQICGLPVVGFGHGGTPEEITDKSGIMVGTENNVKKLLDAIIYVVEKKPFSKKDIISSGNRFTKYECAKRQLIIYKEAINYD